VDYERLASGVGGGIAGDPPGVCHWFGDPRKLWPSETRDFVPWLIDHLDLLGQCLGTPLTFTGHEVGIGEGLRVDIMAADDAGRRIAIEAQIGSSDAEHLGKLPMYGVMANADLVVWVLAYDRVRQFGFCYQHTRTLQLLDDHLRERMRFAAVAVTLESDLVPAPVDSKVPPIIPRLRLRDLSKPGRYPDRDSAIPPLAVTPRSPDVAVA